LASEGEEILIAGDEQVCMAAVREIKEHLIFFVSAYDRTPACPIDRNAIGKIATEQFKTIILGETEFGIGEDACELRRSGTGDKRD
jgi:hypothetical protein